MYRPSWTPRLFYYFEQLLTAHSPAIPKKFILKITRKIYNYPIPNNNNNDRLTAFDPGQPG